MPRAPNRPRKATAGKPGSRRRWGIGAPTPARARKAGMAAGVAMLTLFLGGLAGAHLAISTASQDLLPAARTASAASGKASGKIGWGEESTIGAAAPPVSLAGAAAETAKADEAAEAAMARIYEEPLDRAPREPVDASEDAATPDMIHLASLPAPDIPELVPVRRPPLWRRNAVPVAVKAGQPMIAIVLDDVGLDRPAARRAIELPGPLTLSFMTYARGLRRFAADARAAGHELLLHVPMEPRDPSYDAGPNVLREGLSRDEIAKRLEWGLGRFDGYVGINNHMGSKFTAAPRGVSQVMRALRARDLLFLDSVTAADSVAGKIAARSGVPVARRDVFLDHDWRNASAIKKQLSILERIARRRGYAVGIGHPHRLTLEILAKWLPEARRRGIALVPISTIVNRQIEVAQGAAGSAS